MNISFTNEDICELLTEQTGQKWKFKIEKAVNKNIEENFPTLGMSYCLKFYTEYTGFTVKDELNEYYTVGKCVQSLATMKNVDWFKTWFSHKSIEGYHVLQANTRFKNSVFAIKEIPEQIKNCIAREIISCPDDYRIENMNVKHELMDAFRNEVSSNKTGDRNK